MTSCVAECELAPVALLVSFLANIVHQVTEAVRICVVFVVNCTTFIVQLLERVMSTEKQRHDDVDAVLRVAFDDVDVSRPSDLASGRCAVAFPSIEAMLLSDCNHSRLAMLPSRPDSLPSRAIEVCSKTVPTSAVQLNKLTAYILGLFVIR